MQTAILHTRLYWTSSHECKNGEEIAPIELDLDEIMKERGE